MSFSPSGKQIATFDNIFKVCQLASYLLQEMVGRL